MQFFDLLVLFWVDALHVDLIVWEGPVHKVVTQNKSTNVFLSITLDFEYLLSWDLRPADALEIDYADHFLVDLLPRDVANHEFNTLI